MDIERSFINEQEYPDLDIAAACEHLSAMIRCRTISYQDTDSIDWSQFDRLHEIIRSSYPSIMSHATVEVFGHNLLITIKGSDPTLRPALLMAHQDVVPVIKGTEQDWKYPPFSGTITDDSIWGRGTLDIKNMLAGHLEAVEYLLRKGCKFRRTVILAFAEDEEEKSVGAITLAETLKSRGIELEYVLDEGGSVTDGSLYGADGILVGGIGIYEKGYADIMLKVSSTGGHSSNPFNGTSLGHLAAVINNIVSHPFEPQLPDCVRETLNILKPYITEEPLKSLLEKEDNTAELLEYWLSREELYNQVITTIAPTQITPGSEAPNVMPQNMSATINFRLTPQTTAAKLLEHCRKYVGDDAEVILYQSNEASSSANYHSYGFTKLKDVLSHFFRDMIFVPAVNTGSTDARQYERVCDCCMRFEPYLTNDSSGVHGTNEYIPIRAYAQGIRVIIRLLEETCI